MFVVALETWMEWNKDAQPEYDNKSYQGHLINVGIVLVINDPIYSSR